MDQTAQNLQQQVELYGETLGEVVRRVAPALGLTQSALAQVIGLSAPMLSQLMSAQRVKIGNPAVVSRLRAVSQLADLAIASEVSPQEIPGELAKIRATTGAYGDPTTVHLPRSAHLPPGHAPAGHVPDSVATFASPAGLQAPTTHPWQPATQPEPIANNARAIVREIQDLFRSVASAEEIQRAAAAAATESPAVAELLLAYGTGRTADALSHYEKHHG